MEITLKEVTFNEATFCGCSSSRSEEQAEEPFYLFFHVSSEGEVSWVVTTFSNETVDTFLGPFEETAPRFREAADKILQSSGLLVAHGVESGFNTLKSLGVCVEPYTRLGFCMAQKTAGLCEILSDNIGGTYAYPKLDELYTHLFPLPIPTQKHEAIRRCFFRCRSMHLFC